MITLTKTDPANPDFISLVSLLDHEVQGRYGEVHQFLAQFNKLDSIKHVIIAYIEGKPAGSGAIKAYAEDVAEIKRMFVHPDFRGQGVAKTILAALEDWARELNYKSVILETGIKQPEAIALYRSSKYKQIPNFGQYAGVDICLCFEKEL